MTNFEKVKAFHEKFGLPISNIPVFPHAFDNALRVRLMLEELAELTTELNTGSKESIAKEIADLLYVVYGTAVTLGIPINDVFDKVHKSNMTKSSETDEGGKIIKGKDYKPVNMEELLNAQPND